MDFTRCPSSECQRDGGVAIDYYFDGDQLFFSFMCQDCGTGSLKDDFRWYVRCPNCNQNPSGGFDHVEGSIAESGIVHFRCKNCGSEAEDHVRTRWDNNREDPAFEPNSY